MYPAELRYSEEHEWARDEGDGRIRVGISWYAQDALGDVVFVSLPEIGREVGAGDVVGEVESTKSVSEIYSPISGTVVEANELLIEEPEHVNADPYGTGWIFVIESHEGAGLEALMDASVYEASLR